MKTLIVHLEIMRSFSRISNAVDHHLLISDLFLVSSDWWMQVQSLEVANQTLECQIQKELDRKCPQELSQLETHLRTVSLLQDEVRATLYNMKYTTSFIT